MDSMQRSKLGMGMATRDFLVPNATITTPLPNFPANNTQLVNTITQIQTIAELQDFEKTGITDNKSQLKSTVCILSADSSRKLVAFAMFTNNSVLLKEIKISESELKRLADAELKTKAQEIYDRAQSNVAALTAYGITAVTQTTLLNAINAFNTSIPKPRLGIDEKKQATQQLVVLFKTLDTTLDNIDAVVEIVRLSQPNFYNGYKTARKIIVTGSNTLSVKGLVTDATTGEPVKGVTLMFALDGGTMMAKSAKASSKTANVITKKTAEKGGFKIQSLPAGTYQVTIKKVGYPDKIVSIDVNDGEMTDLDVSI
jgi:hypothetical protein